MISAIKNNKKPKKAVETTTAAPNTKKPANKQSNNKPAQGTQDSNNSAQPKPAGEKKYKGPRKPINNKKNEAITRIIPFSIPFKFVWSIWP